MVIQREKSKQLLGRQP